jgi:electron transfer flavoprotein alpha/beta subunit
LPITRRFRARGRNASRSLRSRAETLKVEEPPKREAGVMVETVAELVDKLKNEARVI